MLFDPEQVALGADGKALLVHGRGANLSVVDLDVPAELARFPLAEAAYAVQPETGDTAWVLLDGPTSRSLVRVDTAPGAPLTTIPLPGGAGTTSVGYEVLPTVLFDLPRGRAFVVSPDRGELALVDLTAGAVVSTLPVRTVPDSAALAQRSDDLGVPGVAPLRSREICRALQDLLDEAVALNPPRSPARAGRVAPIVRLSHHASLRGES